MMELIALVVISVIRNVSIVLFGWLVASIAIYFSPAAKAERFEKKLKDSIRKLRKE